MAFSDVFDYNREGLSQEDVEKSRAKYGTNIVNRKKRKSPFMRVLGAFCDPMLIILCFALAITLGVNVGKYVRTGDGDFAECIGIFCAVVLSVTITAVMEGKSEKAFEMLEKISSHSLVKVKRGGIVKLIPHSDVVVGDVVIVDSGCRVPCDGRIIFSKLLSVDESALTGESRDKKKAFSPTPVLAPLSERWDCLFGGTVITGGSGEMVVTAVGDKAEIGKIAGELNGNKISQPLSEKLARLGKTVTAIGGISAVVLFVVSLLRLILSSSASFEAVQEIFIESVVLIVAAVPEGLPTIVAISLSLNVIKLARENALIKKLVVAETAGCVSVICSDKTGTLTENKMAVVAVVCSGKELDTLPKPILENVMLNTSCEVVENKGEFQLSASPTERALIERAVGKNYGKIDLFKADYEVLERVDFTSDRKYMSTKTRKNGIICTYYKGSPEKIFELTGRKKTTGFASRYLSEARRVIAFAHSEGENIVYDGYMAIADPVRRDVKRSVELCKRAGIRVKILTGDNAETAYAVAREAGITSDRKEVVNATEVERLEGEELISLLDRVSVIARSTPLVKLKVVNALKVAGEVVAVTGDGINDAPAIKQADIGIAMGSGSEIAKEAGDVVLLDDSFSTIIKAISFGRNVYNTFRRFIMFQLSVNFSAVAVVLVSLFLGLKSPFSAMQLLWLNVIMDGPPALTLGFEPPDQSLMTYPPKKRSDNLLDKRTATRVIVHSAYVTLVMIMQIIFDFLGAGLGRQSATFALFVFFQLFNAFNCRQVGTRSIFKGFFKNKAMLVTFTFAMIVQILLTQFGGEVFSSSPLDFLVWIKIILTASSIILLSEFSKLVYLAIKDKIPPFSHKNNKNYIAIASTKK